MGGGLAGYVAKTGETINIEDASKDERFFSNADQKTGFKTRSYLCVPINQEDKVVGTAQVLNKIDKPSFSDSDVEIFETLARQSATSIVNSLLYSEITLSQEKIKTRSDKLSNVAHTSIEIIDNIVKSYDNIKAIGGISQKAFEVSKNGSNVVSEAVQEMAVISDISQKTKVVVDKMLHNTTQIDNFLKTISDIADKTIVLSINAAIEAARAGAKGKGFSVVVDEIRRLSQQITKAAREIGTIVSLIKSNSQLIFESMERELHEIQNGITLVSQSGNAIEDIQSVVDDMLKKVDDIQRLNEKQNDAALTLMSEVGQTNLFDKEI
jgi:methyl-accepting chemotaxis protein